MREEDFYNRIIDEKNAEINKLKKDLDHAANPSVIFGVFKEKLKGKIQNIVKREARLRKMEEENKAMKDEIYRKNRQLEDAVELQDMAEARMKSAMEMEREQMPDPEEFDRMFEKEFMPQSKEEALKKYFGEKINLKDLAASRAAKNRKDPDREEEAEKETKRGNYREQEKEKEKERRAERHTRRTERDGEPEPRRSHDAEPDIDIVQPDQTDEYDEPAINDYNKDNIENIEDINEGIEYTGDEVYEEFEREEAHKSRNEDDSFDPASLNSEDYFGGNDQSYDDEMLNEDKRSPISSSDEIEDDEDQEPTLDFNDTNYGRTDSENDSSDVPKITAGIISNDIDTEPSHEEPPAPQHEAPVLDDSGSYRKIKNIRYEAIHAERERSAAEKREKKKAEKNALKAQQDAEKEAKKERKKAEQEAKKDAEKDAEKEVKKEPEKEAKKAEESGTNRKSKEPEKETEKETQEEKQKENKNPEAPAPKPRRKSSSGKTKSKTKKDAEEKADAGTPEEGKQAETAVAESKPETETDSAEKKKEKRKKAEKELAENGAAPADEKGERETPQEQDGKAENNPEESAAARTKKTSTRKTTSKASGAKSKKKSQTEADGGEDADQATAAGDGEDAEKKKTSAKTAEKPKAQMGRPKGRKNYNTRRHSAETVNTKNVFLIEGPTEEEEDDMQDTV